MVEVFVGNYLQKLTNSRVEGILKLHDSKKASKNRISRKRVRLECKIHKIIYIIA